MKKVIGIVLLVAMELGGQQWQCRYPPNYVPNPGGVWDGLKQSKVSAYIPGDHVTAGSYCTWTDWFGNRWPFMKTYKADGYPVRDEWPVVPARVMHGLNFYKDRYMGRVAGASESRGYGAYSPVGGNLSWADEDGRWYDCYLFDSAGFGTLENYHEQLTFPYSGGIGQMSQAQAHLWGTAANPLDQPAANIMWDVRVVTNYYTGFDYTSAYAVGSHTCFPGFVVQSQLKILHHYMPPRNDTNYVFGCLFVHSGMISVQANEIQVPCQ